MVNAGIQPQARRSDLYAKFFRGLGDPTRFTIIEHLLDGERSVGQLVALLGVPQGRVSTHLACLRWCGYVGSHRRGRNIYYYIVDGRVKDILELAGQVISDNAQQILACQIIK